MKLKLSSMQLLCKYLFINSLNATIYAFADEGKVLTSEER